MVLILVAQIIIALVKHEHWDCISRYQGCEYLNWVIILVNHNFILIMQTVIAIIISKLQLLFIAIRILLFNVFRLHLLIKVNTLIA